MSTKTTFKRIALVAVAALGLGVLSVAPSSAAISSLVVTSTDGTATRMNSDTSTAATVTVSFLSLAAADSVTVQIIAKSKPSGATVGSGNNGAGWLVHDSSTSVTGTVLSFESQASQSAALDNAAAVSANALDRGERSNIDTVLKIKSPQAGVYSSATLRVFLGETTTNTFSTFLAGTYTYTAIVRNYSLAGAETVTLKDFSIVVSDVASNATTPSAVTSFARLNATSNVDASGVDAAISSVATAGGTAGYLEVGVRNAANGSSTAEDSVTASITGAGVLCYSSVCGSSFKIAATGDVEFTVKADGRAGVGTINVSTTVASYAAKTVNFYAAAAKTITTKVAHPVLKVGANAGAVEVSAVDASGTNWTGSAYIVASSAADALIAGSTTPVACDAWNATDGILCNITAIAPGTAKFKVIDASTVAAATATSAEFSVTVSAATANTVKIAFDKATYQPYEKAFITVTPLDSAGKTLPGQAYTSLLATGGISSTQAFTGSSDTLTAVTVTTSASTGTSTTAGSKTYVVYMPAQGDVTISATGGTALPAAGRVTVTATASVVNDSVNAATDAANEATDAANAATDAALAAADAADAATAAAQDASDAVAALSASVSKMISNLRAQITSLTNLVIKIQKKVKA